MEYIESGMDFSPLFIHDNSIYIEKSMFRKKLDVGVKTVEFISLQSKHKLCFIEAKTSAPNPNNPDNKDNVNNYYQDILEKIQHSLDLFVSKEVCINEDSENEFPAQLANVKIAEQKIIFILVIKNHKKEWCSDVLDFLHRRLIALKKIWKTDIAVLNSDVARKKKIIL